MGIRQECITPQSNHLSFEFGKKVCYYLKTVSTVNKCLKTEYILNTETESLLKKRNFISLRNKRLYLEKRGVCRIFRQSLLFA
jgi:hypothetical protein